MTTVVTVAVPVPLRRQFDYLPPASGLPPVGCRCEVNFSGRDLVGIVTGHREVTETAKLKRLGKQLDDAPIIEGDILELCLKAEQYYLHPLGEVLHTALPGLLRRGESAELHGPKTWQLTAKGRHVNLETLKRAPKQQHALQVLSEHEKGLSTSMLGALGVNPTSLKALEKKDWVVQIEKLPRHGSQTTPALTEVPLDANAEQDAAIRAIGDARGFAPYLLDGVTGSGKTEVYLQAMAPHLMAGRQILVLVPEIGLTPQTVRRFSNRFNVPVVLLHSRLTDRERLNAWLEARQGRARIVLGTRSAIFTPLPELGLIIADEAHDTSFKQQDGFRYSARDLAVWRAKLRDIPVVLGTATPSLETFYQAEQGRYRHLQLSQRAGTALPPRLMLEDCRSLSPATPISPRSLAAIGHTLAAGRQALVFINRRGYAPMLQCNDCGWQAECGRCDVFMTWHKQERSLRCHQCDAVRRVPVRCPVCQSPHLQDMGSGTEKLEAILHEQFNGHEIIRIDRDTTRRKGSLDQRLAHIQQGKPGVLVGTQMLAKGHHFRHLDLAVILDADAGFLSADFRGPEHASQLLLQVAGRTGRGHHPGQVIIQTRHPEQPLLQILLSGNYRRIAQHLMEDRKLAGLPPFGHMALIGAEAPQPEHPQMFLDNSRQAVQSLADSVGVSLLGPIPAPLERRSGRYRFQLLLLARGRNALHRLLPKLLKEMENHPLTRRCRWHLDVDPIDML